MMAKKKKSLWKSFIFVVFIINSSQFEKGNHSVLYKTNQFLHLNHSSEGQNIDV